MLLFAGEVQIICECSRPDIMITSAVSVSGVEFIYLYCFPEEHSIEIIEMKKLFNITFIVY